MENSTQEITFDLNDIEAEPSDEVLQALMEEVAKVARIKARAAHDAVLEAIRLAIKQQAGQTRTSP